MNYVKFLKSKPGSILGKLFIVRWIVAKLYNRQQNKKAVALVPSEIVKQYGEKEIKRAIKKNKKKGSFIINSTVIEIYKPNAIS